MDWTNLLMVARLVCWPIKRGGEDGISIDTPEQKKSDNLKKEKLDVLKDRNQCYRN